MVSESKTKNRRDGNGLSREGDGLFKLVRR
jgi:hypothetical protein